jgi:Na+-transporting methylmalonyl-CoA/oxaloacetate decarboxylase gamma subunit
MVDGLLGSGLIVLGVGLVLAWLRILELKGDYIHDIDEIARRVDAMWRLLEEKEAPKKNRTMFD